MVTTLLNSTTHTYASSPLNGVVNDNNVNFRTGPGLTFKIIKRVNKGTKLTILQSNKDWIKATLEKGPTGWISKKYVTPFKITQNTTNLKNVSPTTNSKGIVNVNSLRLRKGPGTNYSIIDTLKKNTEVVVVGSNKDWQKVTVNKKTGYVKKEYISIKKQTVISTPVLVNKIGRVNASSLFIRKGPNTLSNIVYTLTKNDQVKIVKQYNKDWYEVTYNEFKGYSYAKYIEIVKETIPSTTEPQIPVETQPSESTPKFIPYMAKVSVNNLNIRDNGLGNGNVIGSLNSGAEIKVVNSENNWCQIEWNKLDKAYVACWYIEKIPVISPNEEKFINVIYDSTNIRDIAGIDGNIIIVASINQKFKLVEEINNWFKIEIAPNQYGYVAGWLVSLDKDIDPVIQNPNVTAFVKDKKIVIDPGHGGSDSGAIGPNRTLEKSINLNTALILKQKLEQQGAKVIMTRSSDYYVSLKNRTLISNNENADAFISLHYDSASGNASGISTYYYNKTKDFNLSSLIKNELIAKTGQRDRGVMFGNFQVIRENKKPSSLLELGFISNPKDEILISTDGYQDNITSAIVDGLNKFFKK
jgi:N-acetylmuramoyl-L-alanine amidase